MMCEFSMLTFDWKHVCVKFSLLVAVGIPTGSLSLDHIVFPVAEVLGSIVIQVLAAAVALA